MAAALLGDRSQFDQYDSRVFPGYPILIAITHTLTRLPISLSALAVTFISAGVAAALAAMLFDDPRIGWAVAFAMPHVWINMSLAMGEAPALALETLGLWLARNGQAIPAGMIFGLGGLTRPVALFALAASFLERLARGRAGRGLVTIVAAGVVFAAGMLLIRTLNGSFLHGVREYSNSRRAYSGQLFAWPFSSILWIAFHGHVGFWRWIYIMAHVLLCLGGCAALARKNSPTDLLAFIWLSLNTLFVLCIGLGVGAWGFYHFPRFTIPALPALAWSWRRFLPAAAWVYIPLGTILFVMAVYAVRTCP
jgi:Gpi18-like mannosyltransferase